MPRSTDLLPQMRCWCCQLHVMILQHLTAHTHATVNFAYIGAIHRTKHSLSESLYFSIHLILFCIEYWVLQRNNLLQCDKTMIFTVMWKQLATKHKQLMSAMELPKRYKICFSEKKNNVKWSNFVVPWTFYHPCLALLWLPQCQWSIHGGYGIRLKCTPDSRVHGAYMAPTWVLSAQGGCHVGPMNLAIRDSIKMRICVCLI